jgi:anti-sigma B factor antagonist
LGRACVAGLFCNAVIAAPHGATTIPEAVPRRSSDRLQVDVAPDRERVRIRAVGEIDLATAAEIERPLLELFDSGFRDILLDLRGVTFMDSSGIRVLVGGHQQAEKLGARLSIVVGASRIRQALELSGALDYLGVS